MTGDPRAKEAATGSSPTARAATGSPISARMNPVAYRKTTPGTPSGSEWSERVLGTLVGVWGTAGAAKMDQVNKERSFRIGEPPGEFRITQALLPLVEGEVTQLA